MCGKFGSAFLFFGFLAIWVTLQAALDCWVVCYHRYPCPYTELRKFAPAWCTAMTDQRDDSDDENEVTETAKNLGKALDVRVTKENHT